MDTSKRDKQLKTLMDEFNGSGRIDLRRYSRETLRYAENYSLILKGDNGKYTFNNSFCAAWDLPEAVLWEFVKPMIPASGIGYSLSKNSQWRKLNISERGCHFHRERDMSEMEHVLLRLDAAGYIYFQSAGTIWTIDYRPEYVPVNPDDTALTVSWWAD